MTTPRRIKTPTRLGMVCAFLGLLTLAGTTAHAPGIKLITLPVRERVEIQLDNPSATLIEEERTVPLVKGVNQVDFSWANTTIDPDTILFRFIAPGSDLGGAKPLEARVLSVSYPPNENALVWQVASSDSGRSPGADQLLARQPREIV